MKRVLNRVNEASDVEWNIKFSNGHGRSVPIPMEQTTLAFLPPCFFLVDLLIPQVRFCQHQIGQTPWMFLLLFSPLAQLSWPFPQERSP